MKYSDEQRLQKILENAEKLIEYLSEHKVTKENLMNDYALQWLVTTPLYNIGEQIYDILCNLFRELRIFINQKLKALSLRIHHVARIFKSFCISKAAVPVDAVIISNSRNHFYRISPVN